MLLQLLSPRFGWLEIGFIAIFVAAVWTMFYIMAQREKARLFTQSTVAITAAAVGDAATPAAGGFKWRKVALYLLFLGLAVLFVVLGYALNRVPALGAVAQSLPPASAGVLPDVDGDVAATKQQVGGYVQLGGFLSKLLTMTVIFTLFSFLPWDFQKLTHPGMAKWKKESYTQEFLALPSAEKFKESRGVGLARAIIAGAAILGACFIQ